MNDNPWTNFLNWERASRDTIDFKTIYVDMADDLVTGLLLSQIVYWYLPSKKGGSKLRVFKDGYYWIAKARHEWWDEIRVKPRQIDRAIEILEKKGIIVSHLYRFNNAPTTHIRIIKEGFLIAWDNALARFNETVKSELPSDPFSPNRQFDFTDSSSGFNETVKSDLPESVESLTETTIDLTETTAEITGDFPEKDPIVEAIVEQTETHPGPFDLARITEEKQAEAGNYASPVQAGGDSSAAEAGLVALYEAKGSEAPRRHSGGYIDQIGKFAQVLQDCGVIDPAIARLASQLLVEDKPGMANPYYRPFPAEYADYLGRAKRQLAGRGDDDRRACDVEAMQESLAALDERRSAQPPPLQDDEVGQGVKAQLEAQMGRNEFRQYVNPCGFTCDDGVLVVAAPDAFTRDWLENRLGVTIERALAGMAGGPGEIVFEFDTN